MLWKWLRSFEANYIRSKKKRIEDKSERIVIEHGDKVIISNVRFISGNPRAVELLAGLKEGTLDNRQ